MKFDALCNLSALRISPELSCSGVCVRAIPRLHGWRRLVTGRSEDRGSTRLVDKFAPGGVALESLHVWRHELSNHRVEVNRHQPPCLPGRLDFMIVTLHSNTPGQVAVTHPGRWAKQSNQ